VQVEICLQRPIPREVRHRQRLAHRRLREQTDRGENRDCQPVHFFSLGVLNDRSTMSVGSVETG
jgi:hypothetical protein